MVEFIATYINDKGEISQCTVHALSFVGAIEEAAPVVEGLNLVCVALKGADLDKISVSR